MNRVELFEKALAAVGALAPKHPYAQQVLSALSNQLEYLLALERRQIDDNAPLHHMTIGFLAVRDITELGEKDVAELLTRVSEEANRMQYEFPLRVAQQGVPVDVLAWRKER